jgi:hypothetical protein
MNGLSPKKVTKFGLAALSGVVTNSVISEEIGLTAGGVKNLRVIVEVSAVTVVGSVTLKLMGRSPEGSYALYSSANASLAVTTTGTKSIIMNIEVAADQVDCPLHKMLQVVVTTTNAGDAITISSVWIQQEL